MKISRILVNVALAGIFLSTPAIISPRTIDASAGAPLDADLPYKAYLPAVRNPPYTCPQTSNAAYETIAFQGGPYKENRLTDENADFRLSILGYTPVSAYLGFVSYGGGTGNGDAPRFHTMFNPARVPPFVQVYQVNQWNWNENAPPPYGSSGAPNPDWGGHTVLALRTTPGESINVPDRSATIQWDYKVMVLYASEHELTVVYFPYDHVLLLPSATGYAVHMVNFCVDPNLVALYRDQLSGGKRSTMRLPVIRGNQRVGWALTNSILVAIRDGARYMDPRVESDWWSGHP